MTTTAERRAYIAGPLFDEGERWWIERVEQIMNDVAEPRLVFTATTRRRTKATSPRSSPTIGVALTRPT